MPENIIEWSYVARAVWSEEYQVWYPRVRWLCNGNFFSEREYIIGFEDSATAMTLARTLANEEAKLWEMAMSGEVRRLREQWSKYKP